MSDNVSWGQQQQQLFAYCLCIIARYDSQIKKKKLKSFSNFHEAFLDKLNQLHPNLKFTAELGPSTLAFLDTNIELPKSEYDSFSSSIYRKAKYTGLLLNFSPLCPTRWKIGWINWLLHRAYTICSMWKNINKDVFIRNGYPVDIFYTFFMKALTDLWIEKSTLSMIRKSWKIGLRKYLLFHILAYRQYCLVKSWNNLLRANSNDNLLGFCTGLYLVVKAENNGNYNHSKTPQLQTQQ